ncbi:MAG TPA: response regulator [Candidatus Binatia bacterium]|jgi:chemotaxis family two-component system response regulator Rcp1|nr:response regulator [Candidatus Binatia bacterium]
MTLKESGKILEILLVEDNPADARLVREALKEHHTPYHLTVVTDGEAALAYLHQQDTYTQASRPDIVLLDINLPGKNGHEVLAEMKQDPHLRCIPVIVLTSSRETAEMEYCYQLHANAYVVKSAQVDQFFDLIKKIEDFWFSIATLFSGEEFHWEEEAIESPTNGTTVSGPLPKR